MNTPWGQADTVRKLGEGIVSASTASHGGIRLDKERNDKMPEYMRNQEGWYEEDCCWARPAVVFPEAFPGEQRHARETLANCEPDIYERFFNCTLAPGESREKDEIAFKKLHANDYIVAAAWGSWHPWVPVGMVAVCAYPGADRKKECAYFLVSEAEYSRRAKEGFLIDPARHLRIEHID